MLLSLIVKNFAIIDNIEVNFEKGMTVLTGETGAGKSLIIDAIGLLFGNRAKSDLIRYGENKATIEGVFSLINEKVKTILSNLDIEVDDNDLLTIKREIYDNGKSLCKVNGNTISLSNLILLGEEIGDIHTQFDTQILTNPKNYLSLIDDERVDDLLKEYQISLKEYKKDNQEYQDLLKRNNDDARRMDFLKYEINELEKAHLSISEEEDCKNRLNYLNNFEKITSFGEEIKTLLDNNTLENLYTSMSTLKKLADLDNRYQKYEERISQAYYDLTDLTDEIKTNLKNVDFDENEFNELNDRLGLYSDLKRKYKMTTQELIDYLSKIKKEIDEINNYDFYISEKEKKVKISYDKTYKIAKNISDLRKETSSILKNQLKESLNDMELVNTAIEFVFLKSTTFKTTGIDDLDILVSFNKGEPVKPLSKVASGGELSRFMLALKSIISSKLTRQLLIFDEIDNGVSGKVAYSIAKKISSISKYAQVLCVTHLPQVASISDHHWHISKKIDENNRTITIINYLNNNEREKEIASMISNGTISEASILMAKELLKHHFQ